MVAQDRRRAAEIICVLKRRYPQRRRGEVASTDARKPFEVMVSAIISQRNRDEVTDKVATELLMKANTPAKMLKLGKTRITKTIRSANFYKTKAKHIYEAARMIAKNFDGVMPATRAELMQLPGVGEKTADMVMLVSYGADVIPVDVHVQTVSQRLGWTGNKEPEKIREDLHKIFPPKTRGYVNILLVEFGKEFCRMHLPRCYACSIERLCHYGKKNFSKPVRYGLNAHVAGRGRKDIRRSLLRNFRHRKVVALLQTVKDRVDTVGYAA